MSCHFSSACTLKSDLQQEDTSKIKLSYRSCCTILQSLFLQSWHSFCLFRIFPAFELLYFSQGHEGPITGICVQHLEGGSQMIISSSADDTVQIWTNDGPRKIAEQWHTNGNASSEIENLHSQNSQNALQNSSWQCRQKINLPLQIQHALAVTAIPKHPDWYIFLHIPPPLPLLFPSFWWVTKNCVSDNWNQRNMNI